MEPTKDELKQRIGQLEAQVAQLQVELQEREAVARSSTEPGWLFTTINPNYSGTVYGVHFSGGHGFLPMGRRDAKRTMQRIVSDFGYDVQEITAKEFEAVQDGQPPAARSFVEKISKTGTLA